MNRFKHDPLMYMVILSVALVISSIYTTRSRSRQRTDVQIALQGAIQDAGRQHSLVALITERASLAEARADSEATRADSLARAAHTSEIRYVRVKATAPDTCAAVILAADSALADAQAEADVARSALRFAQDAANDYRTGKDSALASLARLRAAGEAVLGASRPSFLERIRPRLTAGVTAGMNPLTYRPAVVAGVGLGWSF